jgi:hypothetical protein
MQGFFSEKNATPKKSKKRTVRKLSACGLSGGLVGID